MATGSDSDVLDKIAEIKDEISTVKTTLSTHVKSKNNVTNAELNAVKDELKEAIKKGKDEQKTVWEALLEAVGLKDVFEAFKQVDTLTLIIVAVGATLAFLKDRVLNYGKMLNLIWERLTGKVWSISPQTGRPTRMTRAETEASQAVSINPTNLTPEKLAALQTALNSISPKIREFNSAISGMKSPRAINGIAKAVGALKAKLTPSPATTISNTASAIGELNTKLDKYDPTKLPKAADLRAVQSAATNLAETAETLRTKFVALSNGFGAAAGSLAGGTA
ncbi:hypothetical protein [Streptomyces sp. A012304]|uniref:hypothetical protein n=1 Tax=Streptomyces sp. A012304 TaxID=375446 RepID=UPI0022303132|nr:hypothetical protein [Streptomyces sp. A012304]GKQ35654.1 hypothetical protein ALMP_21970 [Streptomyces sp. A012304]